MITTIIFDIGEVYLHGLVGSAKYVQQKIGTPVSDYYFYDKKFDQLMLGQITEDIYWKAIIKKNSWKVSVDILKEAARKNFNEIKGIRTIIEKLKQNGYRLGLLSNHAKEWVEYCEITYKYHKLFHEALYSYEAKLTKPNKKIFKQILQKLQVNPKECLLIDDYVKNIETAKNLGMKTIHFQSGSVLVRDLKKKKIRL